VSARAAAIGLLLLGACRSPQAELAVVFPADAGACDQQTDLSCVNYLRFTVNDGSEFSTQCIRVSQALNSLCDLARLADGRELFQLSPGKTVQIALEGLRVFPATSCESPPACPSRTLFKGVSDSVRIGDLAGGRLEVPVTSVGPCGPKERFFFKPADLGCASVCDEGVVVCSDIEGGCLCSGP
jgi:hypothetical protein